MGTCSVILGVVVLSFLPASDIKLLLYVMFGNITYITFGNIKLKRPSLDCSKGEKKEKTNKQTPGPKRIVEVGRKLCVLRFFTLSLVQ